MNCWFSWQSSVPTRDIVVRAVLDVLLDALELGRRADAGGCEATHLLAEAGRVVRILLDVAVHLQGDVRGGGHLQALGAVVHVPGVDQGVRLPDEVLVEEADAVPVDDDRGHQAEGRRVHVPVHVLVDQLLVAQEDRAEPAPVGAARDRVELVVDEARLAVQVGLLAVAHDPVAVQDGDVLGLRPVAAHDDLLVVVVPVVVAVDRALAVAHLGHPAVPQARGGALPHAALVEGAEVLAVLLAALDPLIQGVGVDVAVARLVAEAAQGRDPVLEEPVGVVACLGVGRHPDVHGVGRADVRPVLDRRLLLPHDLGLLREAVLVEDDLAVLVGVQHHGRLHRGGGLVGPAGVDVPGAEEGGEPHGLVEGGLHVDLGLDLPVQQGLDGARGQYAVGVVAVHGEHPAAVEDGRRDVGEGGLDVLEDHREVALALPGRLLVGVQLLVPRHERPAHVDLVGLPVLGRHAEAVLERGDHVALVLEVADGYVVVGGLDPLVVRALVGDPLGLGDDLVHVDATTDCLRHQLLLKGFV
jgi:hypothetical protein